MSDLHELMRSAADAAPRPDDLLAATRGRASRRQRRRRYLQGGSAVLTVTAVVVAGNVLTAGGNAPTGDATPAVSSPVVPLPASKIATPTSTVVVSATPKPSPTTAQPTAATTTTTIPAGLDCSSGYTRAVAPASVASQIGLLSARADYHLQGAVLARQMSSTCPSAALPLIYRSVVGGSVTQSLSLTGPIPQSAPDVETPTYPAAVSATVRGRTGQAVTLSATIKLLNWTEPDGTHWSLEGSGIPQTQLVAIANGLTLTGTIAADPSTLPPGLQPRPAIPAGTTGEHPYWWATYVHGKTTIEVQIRQSPGGQSAGLAGAAAGDRIVTVLGHQAQLNTDNGGGPADDALVSLVWTDRPDVLVEVSGNGLSDQQLEDFAATLTPVTAHDPRLS